MRVTQAFRFELDPNRAARFAYNWGLERCLEALKEGRPLPTAMKLHREWNAWKREHAPWWAEVSKLSLIHI